MPSILDIVRDLRERDPPLRYLEPNEDVAPGKFLEFEMMHWNNLARIVPTEALYDPHRPGDRSFLYRGQTFPHPNCRASLFRDTPQGENITKALLALERFRVAELKIMMEDHPFNLVAQRTGCSVDYHGLAQHYGLPTSLLDLTSNVEIAAFFAIAQWNQEAKRFEPMEDGEGVVYRFDWCAFGPGYSKYFNPVGFGPGLRPARQHAWTFSLKPGIDFQVVPHVTEFRFEHSKSASDELFSRFNGGKWLYPPDCLASLVEKLSVVPFVTMRGIRHALGQAGQSPETVRAAAEHAAEFINTTLGLDILEGYELQPEEADLLVAREQATALEARVREMSWGFTITRNASEPSGALSSP